MLFKTALQILASCIWKDKIHDYWKINILLSYFLFIYLLFILFLFFVSWVHNSETLVFCRHYTYRAVYINIQPGRYFNGSLIVTLCLCCTWIRRLEESGNRIHLQPNFINSASILNCLFYTFVVVVVEQLWKSKPRVLWRVHSCPGTAHAKLCRNKKSTELELQL